MPSRRRSDAKYREAIALQPVVEAALARAGSDVRLQVRAFRAIGEAYWWRPDFARALEFMRNAVKLLESTYGPTDRDLPFALSMLAEVLVEDDQEVEGLEVARRSLSLAHQIYGVEHSISGCSEGILGMALRAGERYGEAEPVLSPARATLHKVAGDHPDLSWVDRRARLRLRRARQSDRSPRGSWARRARLRGSVWYQRFSLRYPPQEHSGCCSRARTHSDREEGLA